MLLRLCAGLGLAWISVAPALIFSADLVEATALDAVPERIEYAPARYPAALQAAGANVDVVVTAIIARDGSVRKIDNIEAPAPEFVEAARSAVQRWRFKPAFAGGQPAEYRLVLTVPFRIEGTGTGLDVSAPAPGALGVVAEPTVDWEVAPPYPAEFVSDPRDGVAVLNLLVDAVGVPSDPVVEYASHPAFGAAAREAVLGWKFHPAERGDTLVVARTHVIVRFHKADATRTPEDRKLQAQLNHALDYDVAPEELIQVPLVYPYEALISGERSTVTLNLLVSPGGQIAKIEPDPGSQNEFGLAAGACVSCWTFHPATKRGEPVFGWVKWQLVFTEQSGELQFDDVSRELLAALRAGTFVSARSKELDRPITPRERVQPKVAPGQGELGEGDAIIEAIVDRNGRVQFPRVVSAPTPLAGYAAATAALRWRFEPPRKGGQPVDVRIKIPFRFVPPPSGGG